MDYALAFLLGYWFGSVPFGLLLAKAAGKGDIRAIGSGNIGATNVLRTGSKWLAAATLLLDFLKGLLPVLLVVWFWGDGGAFAPSSDTLYTLQSLAAFGAVVGHCFPGWLKFKGGKGVATNAGVSFGLALEIGLAYALVWIGVLAVFRISSVAGMSAVIAAAAAAAVFGFDQFVPVLVLIALLIVWLHRANISRLLKGEEPKVGGKK